MSIVLTVLYYIMVIPLSVAVLGWAVVYSRTIVTNRGIKVFHWLCRIVLPIIVPACWTTFSIILPLTLQTSIHYIHFPWFLSFIPGIEFQLSDSALQFYRIFLLNWILFALSAWVPLFAGVNLFYAAGWKLEKPSIDESAKVALPVFFYPAVWVAVFLGTRLVLWILSRLGEMQ